MKSMGGIIALLAAFGVSFFVYHNYFKKAGFDTAPPQEQIDVVGIRSQLLSISEAEKMYVVAHSVYGTLEQLEQEGSPSIGAPQRDYTFNVTPDGSRAFTATATPDPGKKPGWPTLVVDNSGQVTQR